MAVASPAATWRGTRGWGSGNGSPKNGRGLPAAAGKAGSSTGVSGKAPACCVTQGWFILWLVCHVLRG